jgi:hypothetical protein
MDNVNGVEELHSARNVERRNRPARRIQAMVNPKVVIERPVWHPLRDDAEWRLVRRADKLQESRVPRSRQARNLALKRLKARAVQPLKFELFDCNFAPVQTAATIMHRR